MQGLLRDENDTIVCETCTVARNPLTRMRGLLGRRSLARGEGILLQPAGSIHTFFMRFAIEVVFRPAVLGVLGFFPPAPPWRTAAVRKARAVLELGAGEAARVGMRPGTLLRLEVDDERA